MKKICFGAFSELKDVARIVAFWTRCRFAVAAILSAVTVMTPIRASAQFDDVLRNVMQGVLQNALRPPAPAYPRTYPSMQYRGAPATAASDSNMVAELQRMLDDLGYNAGQADGELGPQTERALDNFERDHGLPPSEASPASIAAVRSVWYEQNRGGSPPIGGGDLVVGGGSPAIAQPSFDCARAIASVRARNLRKPAARATRRRNGGGLCRGQSRLASYAAGEGRGRAA